MPRPKKWRKVCCLPDCASFGPLDGTAAGTIVMSIDEYETIRLIDLERLTQEQCAVQMQVARTTIQGIYNNARCKLAQSLVEGKTLSISGGEYELCNGAGHACICGNCRRHQILREEKRNEVESDDYSSSGQQCQGRHQRCRRFCASEPDSIL